MKVEYINPFIDASVKVIESVLQKTPNRGELSARPQVFTTQQINVVCGVTGSIEGQVIYGMPVTVADKIASTLLGTQVVTFDQLAASAIAELGNMICGNSITLLSERKFDCNITPPTIVRGSSVQVTTLGIPAIVVPFNIEDIGEFEVNVSLQEAKKKVA